MVQAPKFEYEKWAKKNLPKESDSTDVWDNFFLQEREKWRNGSDGLTGYHYFHLTQVTLKDRTTGVEFRPYWRDVDEVIFNAYEEAIKSGSDLIFVKRREVGLTSIFGGSIPMCNCFIHPGTNQLITSADLDRVKDLFTNKVVILYDALNERVKPARSSFRPNSQSPSMTFSIKNEITGKFTGLKSSILCLESVKNPQSLEGFGAKSIFLDEFFLHSKAAKVHSSAQASVSKGFVKACPIVMGGSCGETTDEGLKKGEELWNDAEALDIITCFIPGYMGISQAPEYDENGKKTGKILNFCPNGYSDEKAATDWINITRKKLSKAKDKSRYITFVKNYPLTINEVFAMGSGGILPQEIMQKVEEQKIYIQANPPPVYTYKLEETNNGIVAEPHPSGIHHILEMPQPGALYLAGTDPIGWDTDNITKGSEYSIAIKKHAAQTYVHYMAIRSLDEKYVIGESIKAQKLFNNAKTLLEMNKGGVAKKTYKDFGCLYLLAKRPNALGIKFINPDAYGWWKGGGQNPATQMGIERVVKYVSEHTDKMFFKRALDELSRFPHGNTDLLDAIMSCEMLDSNILELSKIMPPIRPPKQIYTVGRDAQGRTVGVWKTVG